MSDKIEFGAGFTAEPRGDGEYYITHPNGGGAMASAAEAALIRALVAARGERDALAADWDALEVALGQYADEGNWIQYDGMGLRYVWVGRGEGMDIASEAIAAARKPEGGPQ